MLSDKPLQADERLRRPLGSALMPRRRGLRPRTSSRSCYARGYRLASAAKRQVVGRIWAGPMAKRASIFFQRGWLDVAGFRPGQRSLDGAYLMFLVEELIAQSALEVVIPTQSIPGMVADRMPDPIKKYIRMVDRLPARETCFNVLAPVASELGLELDGEDRRVRAAIDRDLGDFPIELFDGFELFLSGIEHRAAIDLDIAALRRSVGVVRGQLRGSEGREVLARLEGVLNTYQTVLIPTLRSASQGDTRIGQGLSAPA